MNDLRKMFTTKDFVINSNIVKCISNIDITNESNVLNINDIKEKLGFDEDKIVNIFGNLINKKYIEMNVINNNNEVIEKVNLDPLYDRLALNKKVDNNDTDIYLLFERELGRTLSSFEYEIINKWIEDGISEDIIKGALKEAILNDVRNFKYIDKIVYEWNKKGVKNRLNKEKSEEEIYDGDWLSE